MNVNVSVPDQTVNDMIITAVEQGIGYWAREVCLFNLEGKRVGSLTDQPIENLSRMVVVEDEDGKEHELKLFIPGCSQVVSGLIHMAKAYPRHFANVVSDDHDAETADVFMQCCLFGEIKYG